MNIYQMIGLAILVAGTLSILRRAGNKGILKDVLIGALWGFGLFAAGYGVPWLLSGGPK